MIYKDADVDRIFSGSGTWDERFRRVGELHGEGAGEALRELVELEESRDILPRTVLNVDDTLVNLAQAGWRLVRADVLTATPEGQR